MIINGKLKKRRRRRLRACMDPMISQLLVQLTSLIKQVGAINQQQQPSEMKTRLETIMEQLTTTMHTFIANTDKKIENQEALIRNQASSIYI